MLEEGGEKLWASGMHGGPLKMKGSGKSNWKERPMKKKKRNGLGEKCLILPNASTRTEEENWAWTNEKTGAIFGFWV